MVALLALVSCTQNGGVQDGMTAGEEVLWMHDWMERDYGKRPESGYSGEQYEEHAEVVMDHVNAILRECACPDKPSDIVQ